MQSIAHRDPGRISVNGAQVPDSAPGHWHWLAVRPAMRQSCRGTMQNRSDTGAGATSSWTSFDNAWVNAAAPPLVAAAAVLTARSPLGFLLQGFHVWIHEVGHASISWLSGRRALPLPIGWTNVEHSQSLVLELAFLLGYGALVVVGWRERRPWPMALGAALLATQVWMTWFFGEERARMWMIFAGVGGEFYLAAAMVGLFYLEFPDWFRWGWCRYLVLFLGAASFYETYSFWWKVKRGLEGIPYGSMINGEGDSNGDMNILHDDYRWTQHQIIGTYWHLGNACIVAVVAIYLFYNLRLNRLFNPILARLLSLGTGEP